MQLDAAAVNTKKANYYLEVPAHMIVIFDIFNMSKHSRTNLVPQGMSPPEIQSLQVIEESNPPEQKKKSQRQQCQQNWRWQFNAQNGNLNNIS